MPLFVHAMKSAFAVHREPVKLARQADGKVSNVNHLLHFALALGPDLSRFERDKRAEIVFVFTKLISNRTNNLPALWSGIHAPALIHLGSGREYLFIFSCRGAADAA